MSDPVLSESTEDLSAITVGVLYRWLTEEEEFFPRPPKPIPERVRRIGTAASPAPIPTNPSSHPSSHTSSQPSPPLPPPVEYCAFCGLASFEHPIIILPAAASNSLHHAHPTQPQTVTSLNNVCPEALRPLPSPRLPVLDIRLLQHSINSMKMTEPASIKISKDRIPRRPLVGNADPNLVEFVRSTVLGLHLPHFRNPHTPSNGPVSKDVTLFPLDELGRTISDVDDVIAPYALLAHVFRAVANDLVRGSITHARALAAHVRSRAMTSRVHAHYSDTVRQGPNPAFTNTPIPLSAPAAIATPLEGIQVMTPHHVLGGLRSGTDRMSQLQFCLAGLGVGVESGGLP